MSKKIINEPSRTLMEYRLLPGYTKKEHTLENISLRTPLVYTPKKNKKYFLNIPMVSAAMQSVSGAAMGIELAKLGGAAVIYTSQSIESQCKIISKIKHQKAGFVKPMTMKPYMTIDEMYKIRKKTGYSTFPVVSDKDKFLGLITKWDYDVSLHKDLPIRERMIKKSEIYCGENITNLKEANNILLESHKSVLPILDEQGKLQSMVFRKDIIDKINNPLEVYDEKKRYLAIAAINTHDYRERVPALINEEVDLLAIDSSDGHSEYQAETLKWIKENHTDIPIIAGNIITKEGFNFLVRCGANAVKVGMGGGSICITQEQKGTGRGLATSIKKVAEARDKYFKETGKYIPIIADGGIVNTKDITIALALGADYVMMGRYFARMEESPTEKIVVNNRVMKPYWGEGSSKAQNWKEKRYYQAKFVEGVEGLVEYAGYLRDNLVETIAKIKASMSTCGVNNIKDFHQKAELELVSALSIREGKVHDLVHHSEPPKSEELPKEDG